MLARREVLQHPVAGKIELPLIIPSFSSKGFRFVPKGKKTSQSFHSELTKDLKAFAQTPKQSVLVSAYDIHHKLLQEEGEQLRTLVSNLSKSRVVVIDSGGYELISESNSNLETATSNPFSKYSKDDYIKTLHDIVKFNKLHLIITNFDYAVRGKPLSEQIKEARSLFNQYSDCLTDFIIKPWTKADEFIEPSRMTDTDFEDLRRFDIIGITEKELGENIFERIERLASFRKKLNEAKISSPIHVWGGLDPILTTLYFFAGAEIFDGLSWLKYAYKNGIAIKRDSYSVIDDRYGVKVNHEFNHNVINSDNVQYMQRLTYSLQQWVDLDGNDFDMFDEYVREYIKEAYKTIRTSLNFI